VHRLQGVKFEYCLYMEKVVKASAAKQITQDQAAKLTGVTQGCISQHVIHFKKKPERWHYQAEPFQTPSLTSEALAGVLHEIDNRRLTRNAVSTEGFGLLVADAVHQSRATNGKSPIAENWVPSESFKRDMMKRCARSRPPTSRTSAGRMRLWLRATWSRTMLSKKLSLRQLTMVTGDRLCGCVACLHSPTI